MRDVAARLAVVTALALVATACGDDGPAPPPVTTPEAASPTSAAATPPTLPTEPFVGPFEITTGDGLVLEAERFGTGDTFVVLAHMRPADMSSWFSFAGLLAGEGYSAIAFNFRGYGNSEGAGFAVDVDVLAAIDAAAALGAATIVVIGASMGGTGAVAAAAQRQVAGVVTLSAPASFMGVDAVAAAGTVQAPMLLFASEDDGSYAADAARIAAGAAGPTEQSILAGRAHGTEMFFDHSEAITQAILDFLGRHAPSPEA